MPNTSIGLIGSDKPQEPHYVKACQEAKTTARQPPGAAQPLFACHIRINCNFRRKESSLKVVRVRVRFDVRLPELILLILRDDDVSREDLQ